jgi:two-component system, chemotaxis family, protein-glutamate methylesterase/glutaminase
VIRVLIADDSAFSRVTLSRMIEKDPSIRVVATAVNGQEAIRQAVERQPDLITLDLEMPGMDGFSVLRWLASNRPTPTIVVSSRNGKEDVFRALDLGAIDFIVKPTARASLEYEKLETVLLEKIRAAASGKPRVTAVKAAAVETPVPAGPAEHALILIGASTGGPGAVTTVLSALPKLPFPIVCAQHMPAGFTSLFAERLTRVAPFPVSEASDGQELSGGRAYLAPGGFHLEIEASGGKLFARVLNKSADDFYSPSVNRLFTTAARAAGHRTVAAVLTGMGNDGRAGIQAIRAAGGRTIAESEETCVVFGMPREAAESGAVQEVVPLQEIPRVIVRMLSELERVARPA